MRNAAMINRRHEAGNVTDDSAAEANDERLPVKPRSDHLITNPASLRQRL